MLVFSTKLPIKENITQYECFDLIIEWINGSPHYPYIDINSYDDFDYTKDNIVFSVRHFKDENFELLACRLQNKEYNSIWNTDCIILNDHGKKSLLIQLNCNLLNFRTNLPLIHKPYLVKMFVEKEFCDLDGKLPITDKPIIAKENNYEEYRDIMCGKLNYEMPVVYISKDRFGKTAIDPIFLAHQLSGIAHVFVEENYNIATRLQEDTQGNNAYLGYVGIYFPKTQYCQKHGLEYYNYDSRKMTTGIISDVWDALMNRLDSTQYSWNHILALQARQKMLKMKNISEQSQEELNSYIDTFDKEKKN